MCKAQCILSLISIEAPPKAENSFNLFLIS